MIEAGDLRKTAPLRTLCEKSKVAAALACYADDERDLVRLIDDEMRAAKLTIAPDARAALVSLLGGDRQASRSEIRKLALYAHGKERVELDDVLAVVADASALALDAVIDAAFAGRTGEAEAQFAKALDAGTSAAPSFRRALRHVGQLHKARLAVEAGERTEHGALQRSSRRSISAARRWSSPRLSAGRGAAAARDGRCWPTRCSNVRRTPALATRSASARCCDRHDGQARRRANALMLAELLGKRRLEFTVDQHEGDDARRIRSDCSRRDWCRTATSTSPAFSSTSPSSSSMVISPDRTIA